MANRDPRLDAYIAKSADFARPIIEYLRELVHAACPEVEEGLKWSMPFFSYRGSPMCMMSAFEQHCGFGFWLSRQVVGETAEDGMGQFGRIVLLKDLPPRKQIFGYLKKAMALNEAGMKQARSGLRSGLHPVCRISRRHAQAEATCGRANHLCRFRSERPA
jgi:hypothetical protein